MGIPGHPIIETSRDIRFGALPRDFYEELEMQMKEANLTINRNDWNNIYDFSPDNPAGCTHFSLLSPEDTDKVIAGFSAKPDSAAEVPANDPKGESAEAREVRVTGKRGPQFHANLCRAYFSGRPEADGKPAMSASSCLVLSGAGAAVGTASHAATILQREGIASITSISTGLASVADEKAAALRNRGQAPMIRITLERLSA